MYTSMYTGTHRYMYGYITIPKRGCDGRLKDRKKRMKKETKIGRKEKKKRGGGGGGENPYAQECRDGLAERLRGRGRGGGGGGGS